MIYHFLEDFIRKLLKMFIFKDTIGKYIEVSGIGGKI